MILKLIYIGECDVGSQELREFLSTGKAPDVARMTDEMVINEDPKNSVDKLIDGSKSVSDVDMVTNAFNQELESSIPVNKYNDENIISLKRQI